MKENRDKGKAPKCDIHYKVTDKSPESFSHVKIIVVN